MKSKYILLAYVIILNSLGFFATDIYLPSLPAIASYFSTTENNVQLTLFSYLLSFTFTPLIFGPLSDKLGRRKVIFLGLILGIISTIACFFSMSIWWLIVWRFIQGTGTGAVMIASRSIIPDTYTGKEMAKQISYLPLFVPIVLALAPLIGGFLQEAYGWQSVFLFLLAYMGVILVSVVNLDESLKELNKEPISSFFSNYFRLIKNRSFMLYAVAVAIPMIALFAFLTTSPFLFQVVLGATPSEFGMICMLFSLAILVASFFNTQLLNHFLPEKLILVGCSLVLLSGVFLLTSHLSGYVSIATLSTSSFILFSCLPFIISNSMVKAFEQLEGNFGSANGIISAIQFLGGVIGSLIFSTIHDESVLPIAICFCMVGVASILNYFIAHRAEVK